MPASRVLPVGALTVVLDHSGSMNEIVDGTTNSKQQIADEIKKHVECDVINSTLADKDSRNFNVSFKKIRALGFGCTIGLKETIEELVKLYSFYRPTAGDANVVF